VRLMDARRMQTALDLLGTDAGAIAVYARSTLRTRATQYRRMPDDAGETARQLFAVLREFDAAGGKLIWVETPPEGAEWDGVRDRLRRAAAG
jgi:L-threonylcarbamoyladenylate synthase